MPHLVTSQQAQDHIRDFNDARYNAGIVGNGFYLLQGQGNMEATMVNSNTLRIMSGDAIANGRHWSIDDSYEEYTIENGTPGYKRIDLAVAHIETMPKATIEIRILKGEEATGTPEKPSYIEGDLNDGDTVIEVPICSVLIDGINPGEPVSEMMILMSYDEFRKKTADDMKELRDSLSQSVETYANGSVCVTVNPASRTAIASIVGMRLTSGTTASVSVSLPAEYAPTIEVDAPIVDTNAGRVGWAWVSKGGTTIKAHAPSSPSGSAWYGQLAWHF